MRNKLKGKCKKCVGCSKIFERGFKGVKSCKYYSKETIFNSDLYVEEEESILSLILFTIFVIFIIIAVMFVIYRVLMLDIGG